MGWRSRGYPPAPKPLAPLRKIRVTAGQVRLFEPPGPRRKSGDGIGR